MKLSFPIIPEPGPWNNNSWVPQLIARGVIPGDILQFVNKVNNDGRWLNVVTEIQDMNKEQTSYWIWTIGWTKEWKQAKFYASKFLEHDINGSQLVHLTHWTLEKELHIMNSSHRNVILESIGYLLCNPLCGTGSLGAYSFNTGQSSNTTSYYSANEICSEMETGSWSVRTRDYLRSEASSKSTYMPRRARWRLVLTPKTDAGQGCGLRIADIERKFRENDYSVKVDPWDSHPNSFIVTFDDIESMKKALNNADNLGYHLERKLQKRPSPNSPVKYRVLTRCLIRAGKSLKTKGAGYLKKNDIVLVNQLKRRRARLVKAEGDGSYKVYGWVNVHQSNGVQLLEQLDHKE